MREPDHVRESWLHRYTSGGTPRKGWRDRAECRGAGPDLWYPEASSASSAPAVEVCVSCPVRLDCLHDAFEYEREFSASFVSGIRGGLPAKVREMWLRAHPECRPEGWMQRERVEVEPEPVLEPANLPGQGRQHGRVATYSAGCRCDWCRDAIRVYQRRRRARVKVSAA